MRRRFGNRAVQRFTDLPTAVVSVLWIAIWLLWPGARGSHARRALPRPGVAYIQTGIGVERRDRRPDLFRGGFRLPDADEGEPEMLVTYPTRAPKFLEYDEVPRGGEERADLDRLLGPAALPERGYRPFRTPDKVFPDVTRGQKALRVDMSGELREHGLSVPEDLILQASESETPWSMALYVEIGEDGSPRHVFLDSGTQDRGLNDRVVRLISRGRLAVPGEPCSGRIRLSYGHR
jgi:hypothetical protein